MGVVGDPCCSDFIAADDEDACTDKLGSNLVSNLGSNFGMLERPPPPRLTVGGGRSTLDVAGKLRGGGPPEPGIREEGEEKMGEVKKGGRDVVLKGRGDDRLMPKFGGEMRGEAKSKQ